MKKYKILIPLYNDWKSVVRLLENIDLQVINWNVEVSVLIVNDASSDKQPENLIEFKKIKSIQILNMKQHQWKTGFRGTKAGLIAMMVLILKNLKIQKLIII